MIQYLEEFDTQLFQLVDCENSDLFIGVFPNRNEVSSQHLPDFDPR